MIANQVTPAEYARLTKQKARKFHNVPLEVDGLKFDSGVEAERYGELQLQERIGEIRDLAFKPRWPLVVNGVKIAIYEADAAYTTLDGRRVVEDVKPAVRKRRDGKRPYTGRTAAYGMKKRLMLALYWIKITEVDR